MGRALGRPGTCPGARLPGHSCSRTTELGNRSAVAAVYQRCREALFNDLGVGPSAATRRLYERLRQDEPEPTAEGGESPTAAAVQDDAPATGEPPYQGLHYFDEGDAERFFGRERVTARLLGRLRTESFLGVIGASGSGKSSIVRAGLVPALRRARGGADAKGRSATGLAVLTPTAHPLEALATSLLASNVGGVGAQRVALLDELSRDPHGLRRFLGHREQPAKNVLLVVDQFEEVFTLCNDSFEREAFVENLLGASDGPDGPGSVVIALRADSMRTAPSTHACARRLLNTRSTSVQ